MNLYEQQAANRRKTWLIMSAFVLVLLFLGAGFDAFYIGEAGGFVPVGSLSLADCSVVGRFVRWDADGIAYRTGSQVILLRSSLIGG